MTKKLLDSKMLLFYILYGTRNVLHFDTDQIKILLQILQATFFIRIPAKIIKIKTLVFFFLYMDITIFTSTY